MAILDITNLKKSYTSPDGEPSIVIDIPRFTINEGEQVALEGSSGSGKTTLLNLIAGILLADSGSIVLSGRELTSLSEAERDRLRANTTGYIFQTFNLLQGYTALENVLLGMMFGNGIEESFALALLERVGLEDRINYKPQQLSVGQQQRIAVARALANKPKLVLADEPTGNLDQRHAREAIALIRQICSESNAALLLVSHDHEVLGQFEKVEQLTNINRIQDESRSRNNEEVQP